VKVLTATTQTQGQRDSDFACCIPGELVQPFAVICDRDLEEGPDGGCGCGRSFAGLNSSKATTTALVKDIAGYTVDDLVTAVMATLQQEGWADEYDDPDRTARELAEALAETAADYDDGDVLEIRLGVIGRRQA
jgi:hypothetical protein